MRENNLGFAIQFLPLLATLIAVSAAQENETNLTLSEKMALLNKTISRNDKITDAIDTLMPIAAKRLTENQTKEVQSQIKKAKESLIKQKERIEQALAKLDYVCEQAEKTIGTYGCPSKGKIPEFDKGIQNCGEFFPKKYPKTEHCAKKYRYSR